MHFHLPKPLHGWRELAGEVGIIVIGVLIALTAEQVVESLHWQDKVRHAEDAMRLELAEDDGPQAYARVIIGPCMDSQLAQIHDAVGHVPLAQVRQMTANYMPPFRTWDSEAWKTVLGSDIASHMRAERLVQWSSPYRIVNNMTTENAQERDMATNLREAIPPQGELSAADLQELRRETAQLRNYNNSLFRGSELLLARSQSLGANVPEQMKRGLLSAAREIYGQCARQPELSATPMAARLNGNLRLQPIENGR